MAWLANLDARATHWILPLRGLYLLFRYGLLAIGAYLAIGLAFVEWSEHRIGLGTGLLVAGMLGIIKGVLTAWRAHR